jgi:hypothetical protein
MKLIALALLASALLGCSGAPPHVYEFAWGAGNPPEDAHCLDEAVAHWNACGGPHLRVSDEGIPVTFVEAMPPGFGIDPTFAGTTLGRNDGCVGCVGTGTHVLYRHDKQRDSRALIEHEIGHVMGLDHFGETGELMSAEVVDDAVVGEEDCARIRALAP